MEHMGNTHIALERHRQIMQALAERHRALLDIIGDAPVQYLDIPMHGNIGDLLIYLGTLSFLRRNNIRITQIATHFNYTNKVDRSILLLHGGGNLGDIYPVHQQFREAVIRTNPQRRIIILPQSIHFKSDIKLRQAAQIFSAHPDMHLCVRDTTSLQIGQQLCKNALLIPDMAHQLYPVEYQIDKVAEKTLKLLRTDVETVDRGLGTNSLEPVTDWPILVGYRRGRRIRRATRLAKTTHILGLSRLLSPMFAKWWELESLQFMHDAVALFAPYDRIITDRLHAHILACLMDKQSIVHDNSYGKISNYVLEWTHESPMTQLEMPA